MTKSASKPLPILKIEGPPGSGKSHALAREACRLIVTEGVSSSRLLVLCMTPVSQRSLRHYLKEEAKQAGLADVSVSVLTLEEWLLRLLGNGDVSSPEQPRFLVDLDAQLLLRRILRESTPPGHPLHHAVQQVSASRLFFEVIRQLQLQQLNPEQVLVLAQSCEAAGSRLPLLAEVYGRFQRETQALGLFCHADLANQALQRVTSMGLGGTGADVSVFGSVLPQVILIDEAQELSEAHHQILAALPCQLVLSGNEKLSIRSFRGARPDLFQTLSLHSSRPVAFLNRQACLRGNEAILSLLNRFLPDSIWETQAPELPQLAEQVKFGFYLDPQQEAQGVASLIADFVANGCVEERPARWRDCVVLLRSAHYRQHLIQALLEKGIPFKHEQVSEAVISFQQALQDLLQVFSHWQALQLNAQLLSEPRQIRAHLLSNLPLTLLEREELLQENNRHLLRWLEVALAAQDTHGALRHLKTAAAEGAMDSLLLQLSDADALAPMIRDAYRQLGEWYAAYCQSVSVITPVALLAQTFVNESSEKSLVEAVSGFQNNLERLNHHYQCVFNTPMPIADVLDAFHDLWDGTDNLEKAPQDVVRLMSIHQVQGETFPLVLIPFLVSEEFPYTREIPELLSQADQQAIGVSLAYGINEAEEARLLAVGMSRPSQRLVLSCHRQNEDATVLPSPFYSKLLAQKRMLLTGSASSRICGCEHALVLDVQDCEVDFCPLLSAPSTKTQTPESSDDLYGRYIGESAWAKLGKMAPEPLFLADHVLDLSASSIKTYMQCPRQYYYKHLLRLPQPGNQAASLGTLIHRVMELFNQQAGQFPYTVERLKQLAEKLFVFDDDLETFYEAGFNDKDLRQMRVFSQLTLSSMRQRLMETIDDLARKGYFDRYGTLKQVFPEKRLEGVMLEGLDGCRLSGSMDALVQLADGTWEIIDYKTFRNAYKMSWDTCEKNFRSTLEPLPDDEDLTHAQRFADKLSIQYPKDYQLPLYYLACRQNPEYCEQLRSVSLQMMRPAFPEKPEQGSIRLEITASEIETHKAQLLGDIQRYIVSPIRESASFATEPSRLACGTCGYFGICEAAEEADSEAGGAE